MRTAPTTKEVFVGCPEVSDACMCSSGQPNLAIDEGLAAEYACEEYTFVGAWGALR